MNDIEREGFLAHAETAAFRRKVDQATSVIREAIATVTLSHVAVSWGKDSVVLLHLCQQVAPSIPAIHFSGEMEHLQGEFFAVRDRYLETFFTCYGEIEMVPGRGTSFLSLSPEEFPLSFVGCRAEESANRRRSIKQFGLIHQYRSGRHSGRWRAYPLAWWTWMDVWAYTCQHGLPYQSIYDQDRKARTAVVHGFGWQDCAHLERPLASGAIAQLKRDSPEFFNEYVRRHPEISLYV